MKATKQIYVGIFNTSMQCYYVFKNSEIEQYKKDRNVIKDLIAFKTYNEAVIYINKKNNIT